MPRESMSYDVVIVGGGPAGLASAIRLKQRARQEGHDIDVCLIDKAAEIGGHSLSGAILDPGSLTELLPDWQNDAPAHAPVGEERFLCLGQQRAWQIPQRWLPGCLDNRGNLIVSLGELCRHLARRAEDLGVEIYAGFAAAEVLVGDDGAVRGVATGDSGIRRDGSRGPAYQPGVDLNARYTLFAEGCRGHLGKRLEERFALRRNASPQVYSLGIKELWEVAPSAYQPGLVIHSVGWPLDRHTQGGGFLYHQADGLVAVGLVVGLGYRNPYLSPSEEFQRLKTHPALRPTFAGGRRIAYGARTLCAGGIQSLPELVFPGGALIGDDAGFLNGARLKGIHAAIRSGQLAADACFAALQAGRTHDLLTAYPAAFRADALFAELQRARNVKPALARGLWSGCLLTGIDQTILRGKAPWTLRHAAADHTRLVDKSAARPIDYPPPDGSITFDRPSSVHLSSTDHVPDQPCHLVLRDPAVPIAINLARYDAPEQRYCPAGVYEIVRGPDATPRLQINAQNCLHCKACDIKDPTQNIDWVTPQGGEGPNYARM